MFKIMFLALAFLSSSIALGQAAPSTDVVELKLSTAAHADEPAVDAPEAEAAAPDFVTKTEPDYTSGNFLAKLMSFLTALYMGMWMLGEILTRISVWTENKWDNKAAEYVSQATWFVGAFAGRMGWKLPKLVIEHEAEKIAAKKVSASSSDPKV